MGYGFVKPAPFTWSSPDSPRLISLEPVRSRYAYGSDILVRGNAIGKAKLSASANGVSDSGSVQVIERLARIDLSPTAATIHVGDTAHFSFAVITAKGDTFHTLIPLWGADPVVNGPIFNAGPGIARGVFPGVADYTVRVAGLIGRARVTVLPRRAQ
jgi:hypothetical protein